MIYSKVSFRENKEGVRLSVLVIDIKIDKTASYIPSYLKNNRTRRAFFMFTCSMSTIRYSLQPSAQNTPCKHAWILLAHNTRPSLRNREPLLRFSYHLNMGHVRCGVHHRFLSPLVKRRTRIGQEKGVKKTRHTDDVGF
jgi:hypothetical protein